jgi:hypothetical protein
VKSAGADQIEFNGSWQLAVIAFHLVAKNVALLHAQSTAWTSQGQLTGNHPTSFAVLPLIQPSNTKDNYISRKSGFSLTFLSLAGNGFAREIIGITV